MFSDNAAGRWRDCRDGRGAYGGTWTENVVQAISRDLLADAMLRIEAAGYPIVLHVHDEIVCEVPRVSAAPKNSPALMTRKPSWALTLPIAAESLDRPALSANEEERTSMIRLTTELPHATATQRRNTMLLASDLRQVEVS